MQTVNFDTNGKTVRTTLICTAEEWASILTAVQGERRKTVRSKRPAQQAKHKIMPMCCTCASRNTELNCGTCRGHSNYSPA
jgi:hypothetical protein